MARTIARLILLILGSIIVSTGATRAVDLVPYANLILVSGQRPFCHGIVIDRTLLTAAHCLKKGPAQMSILYLSHGAVKRVDLVAPAFQFPSRRSGAGSELDLGAIRIEQDLAPDADGILSLSQHPIVTHLGHAENAYLEQRSGPFFDRQGSLSTQRRVVGLTYQGKMETRLKFVLRVPSGLPRDVVLDDDGHLVRAPANSLPVPEDESVCQGDSGSAVFAEINGTKNLIGFASAGEDDFRTGNRFCGNTLWTTRLDRDGIAWIRERLGNPS